MIRDIHKLMIDIGLPDFKIQNTGLKKKMNNVYFECHNANIFFLYKSTLNNAIVSFLNLYFYSFFPPPPTTDYFLIENVFVYIYILYNISIHIY